MVSACLFASSKSLKVGEIKDEECQTILSPGGGEMLSAPEFVWWKLFTQAWVCKPSDKSAEDPLRQKLIREMGLPGGKSGISW